MKYVLSLLFIATILTSFAQDSIQKSRFNKHWFDFKDDCHARRVYVYWGYNRDFFSTSNIHFKGPGYNFTINHVAAKDRPSKFTADNYLNPAHITIPQYVGRLGFYVKKNFHISFGIDHLKYVMAQNQTVGMTGDIDTSVSQTYAGNYANKPQLLTSDFLRFEHTNGLNLVTLDLEYLLPIYHTRKDILHIGWNFGVGGAWVITKTEVHLMGFGLDNKFHLSGICVPFKTGPRIDIWRYFFLMFEVKGGYMHLPDVPVMNDAPDRADHNFTFVEYYGAVGFSYKFGENREKILKKKTK